MSRNPLDCAISAEAVAIERGEDADEMAAVLDALGAIECPPVSRWVFLERARGATYAEMACDLGVSVERIRQRYFKTERAIKRRLRTWGL